MGRYLLARALARPLAPLPPITLTDWPICAIGERDRTRPILSRNTQDFERHHEFTEGELACIVWASIILRHLLEGSDTILVTDHSQSARPFNDTCYGLERRSTGTSVAWREMRPTYSSAHVWEIGWGGRSKRRARTRSGADNVARFLRR